MKHTHLAFSVLIVSIFVSQLVIISTYAQWSTDPNVNSAICTAINDQSSPTVVSDNSGGAIIAWSDYRNGVSNADIYAQRIDAGGIVRWQANGVEVSAAAGDQFYPTIAGDGNGGAIITWADTRNGVNNSDIYAQHINASGMVQWVANGAAICTAQLAQFNPTIVSDGGGGAIIIWQDRRSGVNYDIYAQRISADGAAQWIADGVAICTEVGSQDYPTLISAGNGGAITTWNDHRSGHYDIYAQLIDSNGAMQWTVNGVEICTAAWEQSSPTLVSDGSSGAIITWEDYRTSPVVIYAQRIDVNGVVQWTADGVAISALAYDQVSPAIVSDGSGGAIITWQVNSSGNDYDIYVQRIDANGLVQWTVNGMAICTAGHHQQDPTIISDGSSGAIITWEDQRSGTNYDIYAQRIDANGLVQWAADGVAISTATYDQLFPTEVGDGNGGSIITWQDYRVSYPDSLDIYAQQVNADGNLGVVTGIVEQPTLVLDFVLKQNYPNPFNPVTTIPFRLPSKSVVSLKVFNALGREVVVLLSEELPAGTYSRQWNATGLASGVYYYRLQAGSFVETRKLLLLR